MFYLRPLCLSENSYDWVVEEKGREKNDSGVLNVLTDIVLATVRKTACQETKKQCLVLRVILE